MTRRLIIAAGFAAVAIAAAGGHGAAAQPGADTARTRTVAVADDFFSPRSLRVSSRDVVRFVWRRGTDNPHNVTPTTRRGGRASRTTSRDGYVFRRRFSRTTRLICTVHPDTMRLTVRVRR